MHNTLVIFSDSVAKCSPIFPVFYKLISIVLPTFILESEHNVHLASFMPFMVHTSY